MMTAVQPGPGPVLAIDLRLDWDLVVPEAVAAEAATAAGVLARLARRPALSPGGRRGMLGSWTATALAPWSPCSMRSMTLRASAIPLATSAPRTPTHKSPLTDRDRTLLSSRIGPRSAASRRSRSTTR